jgi:hypothetical protein
MSIAINGTDGNLFGNRDIDASPNNFVFSNHRLVFTGNYVTGGDTLDLTTIVGLVPTASLPLQIYAQSNGGATSFGAGVGGYYEVVQAGAALNTYKLKAYTAGGTELAAGAYPASVTSDVVTITITWRKLQ